MTSSSDIFVIKYGSFKWGWKFRAGVVQKLFDTKVEAIAFARQKAKMFESDVYVEDKGEFRKLDE